MPDPRIIPGCRAEFTGKAAMFLERPRKGAPARQPKRLQRKVPKSRSVPRQRCANGKSAHVCHDGVTLLTLRCSRARRAAIALDTGTFSSIGMLQPPARSSAAATADAIRATTYPSVPMLVANDPPAHDKYRRISNAILSAKRMKEAVPLVEATVERYLHPMLRKGGGPTVRQN